MGGRVMTNQRRHDRACTAYTPDVDVGYAADLPGGVDRLIDRVLILGEAPMVVLRPRVAPDDREYRESLLDEVLEHAASRREVEGVVLVDDRRHDEDRLLAHLR